MRRIKDMASSLVRRVQWIYIEIVVAVSSICWVLIVFQALVMHYHLIFNNWHPILTTTCLQNKKQKFLEAEFQTMYSCASLNDWETVWEMHHRVVSLLCSYIVYWYKLNHAVTQQYNFVWLLLQIINWNMVLSTWLCVWYKNAYFYAL
jgi:hypothetical protein